MFHIVTYLVRSLVSPSNQQAHTCRLQSGENVQVGDFVFGLVPKPDESFEEEKFPGQVGRRPLSFWNREGFVFQLRAVRHDPQVVFYWVDGNADVNPRELDERGCVCRRSHHSGFVNLKQDGKTFFNNLQDLTIIKVYFNFELLRIWRT